MRNTKLTLLRIQKQSKQLKEDSIPGVLVKRVGTLHFHFCIYDLEDAYKDGFYHGVLQLHEDYPFAPPTLKFFTPSGRFDINKPICTTFTNFHKESWTSAWNVRTMTMATVSFMTSNEGGYGSLNQSFASKRHYAINSMSHNIKNQKFRELFSKQLQQRKLWSIQKELIKVDQRESKRSLDKSKIKSSNKLYVLYTLLMLLFLIYMYIWYQTPKVDKSGYQTDLPTFGNPHQNGVNQQTDLPIFGDPHQNGENQQTDLPTFGNPHQNGENQMRQFQQP